MVVVHSVPWVWLSYPPDVLDQSAFQRQRRCKEQGIRFGAVKAFSNVVKMGFPRRQYKDSEVPFVSFDGVIVNSLGTAEG